jgi:hypothetical protein
MSRFFRGNYGSQLGDTRTAANLIAQAGATQGQALANMGGQLGGVIGGAIEKYQLNKEKREAEERTAMGNLAGFSPQELAQISGSNPQLGKAIENAMSDKASPKDFQLINASSAPIVAGRSRRLQEENAQIKNSLSKLNLEMAQILQLPKVRDAIAQYELNKVVRDSNRQTIPSDTAVRLKTNESTIKTLPIQTDATISSNKATKMKGDTASAYILGQGGPAGMAKQQMEDDDLKRRGLEADIRSKDTLSDYRIKSIELLEGKSNLPQGSGNEGIEVSIKDIDSEIDRIMKGQTFSKDSDGNTLSYSDLIKDINPITGEVTLSEDASSYASKDIARLKELIQGKMQLRLSQKYKVVNRNGELIEVSLADIEEQKAKQRKQQAEIQDAVSAGQLIGPQVFPMPDYH